MAKKLYEESGIQAIADAIREKNGLTETYTVSEMAAAVLALSGGSAAQVIFPPADGWSAHQIFYYGSHSMGTCSFDGGVFTGSAVSNQGAGMISMLTDLSGVNTVRIEFTASGTIDGYYGQVCAYVNGDRLNSGDNRVVEKVASAAEISAGVMDIDVSSLSGSYYIITGVDVWSSGKSASCTISKIRLE